MKKEDQEGLFDLLDNVFNEINNNNRTKGTGLTFNYKFNINPENKTLGKPVEYVLEIGLREMGHGDRTLQAFTYHKPESYNLNTMKYQVLLSVITTMFESTLLQWNELGKLLNTDASLREAAIKVS